MRRSMLLVLAFALSHTATPSTLASVTNGTSGFEADFNGDGYADLAVGVPEENFRASLVDSGAVNVLYGSASGLSSDGNQFWGQDSLGVLETSESGDNFGAALAAGDFDGDGFADLAVGVPDENAGPVERAGAVAVLYGSAAGLTADRDQLWTQDSPGIRDTAEDQDHFGDGLVAGDMNGDGFSDLAVGIGSEDMGATEQGGAVAILYGSASGLAAANNQLWTQDSPGVLDRTEDDDSFGGTLVSADFSGDGFDDLAVGVQDEDIRRDRTAGAVQVLYGSADGISATGNQFWTQDSQGIGGETETGDAFGSALAGGDFDADGLDDLAVGVPGEGTGTMDGVGSVAVLYGSAAGISAEGSQLWSQDMPGIEDASEADDLFGSALSAADLNGDTFADLVVGAPEEDGDAGLDLGVVAVLYGSTDGISAVGNQLWSQDTPGILDQAEQSDTFGAAVAAADFDGDSFADLVVGVPRESLGLVQMGAANVLYGSAGGIASERNQLWSQDSPGILDEGQVSDRFGSVLAAR